MKKQYVLHALGYEMPPIFDSLLEARSAMADEIVSDIDISNNKLVKIRHDKDHYELKIGSRQSLSTFSEYWIEAV